MTAAYSSENPIAYFCAEFGVDTNLPIYAGGLGVLSGDTLKAAVDLQLPVVAVGLLYRGEDAVQKITPDGTQIDADFIYDPLSSGLEHVYLEDRPLFIKVHLTEIDVWVRCWKKQLGETVTLYLLDTETDQNALSERSITQALYCGTQEELLKQQMILGIGGVKLLHTLGIYPKLYHINEGRPSFLYWQLVREAMSLHQMSYADASAHAKENIVYTNHTLVGAGNPSHELSLVKTYARYYADRMGISVDELILSGMESDQDRFWITRFALNNSRKASGVSSMHTKLSQECWPEYNWVNITNGVHLPTWQDSEIVALKNSKEDLWQRHNELKRQTMEYVKQQTGYGYNPHHMVITWARRIAGYKQLDQVFADAKRLKNIVAQQFQPVQILISGKAHHDDTAAKAVLQHVIKIMQTELNGHALFVPNYSIEVAQHLTRGSDLWLNTPIFGREASGTSGMKAVSNGVLHCTVADGWAKEVDWSDRGWVLDHEKLSENLYEQLEDNIIPLFYERDSSGIPHGWVERMQKSIELAEQFSAKRMVGEYVEKLYG